MRTSLTESSQYTLDRHMKYYLQILEYYNRLEEAKDILVQYRDKHRENLNAHKYLYHFCLKHGFQQDEEIQLLKVFWNYMKIIILHFKKILLIFHRVEWDINSEIIANVGILAIMWDCIIAILLNLNKTQLSNFKMRVLIAICILSHFLQW